MGRNGYIVTKYDSNTRNIQVLKDGENILKYENIKDCNLNRNIHNEKFNQENTTKILALEDDLIKNDKNTISDYLINKTGIECREHNSEYNNMFYYGGIDKDNKMKCYSDNMECVYYKDKKECESNIEDLSPKPAEFYNLNPLDSQDPTFIPEEHHNLYKNFIDGSCLKTKEKKVVCKHIHNRALADLITFNINNCIEKNAKQILDNREVIELRNIPGLPKYTKEQEIEYYKNKYFIEPYVEQTKDYNPIKFFDNIRYFAKLKNNFSNGIVSTVCEIIKKNKDGKFSSIGYMKDNNNSLYQLKNKDRIYININNNNNLIFSILDTNNNIISRFQIPEKIKGNFGSAINFYIATNNSNIFEEPNYTVNMNNVIIPYISNIEIDFE